MLLSVTGVSKQFGRNTVLENAGFSVREGEILGLIGPNGAGKTTLFECLAGLIAADEGTVRFRDSELPPAGRKQALHYLPDAIRPWPDQPVRWVLSKGELKRLLLALGLLPPHPLLLLDEPFDGLDFRQTRDVMALLRDTRAQGRTLFLSIHQLNDAARICDRLVLLSRGRVVGEGTLDELRAAAGLADGGLEEVFLALT